MTLQLTTGTADRVAGAHEAAGRRIARGADAAPETVDAGAGTSAVLGILAACAGTAADLVALDLALAGVVRHVAADLDGTDDGAAAHFAELAGGRR